jgi:predicted Zn-dependent protease
MRSNARLVLLAALLALGGVLCAALYVGHVSPPLPSTLTGAFQIVGAPAKLVDRSVSRILPVGSLEERDLGETLRRRYDHQLENRIGQDPDQAYVDALMSVLARHARKPFRYRAYVVDDPAPNALAMPGGTLLVTRGLLFTLHSEAELVAVLGHEIGHVELGHCFDAVRFHLLAKKIGSGPLGSLADQATAMLVRHAFSKTLEDEADTYAWDLVISSEYDPGGVGKSFEALLAYLNQRGVASPQHAAPFRDYFLSHPPLEVRAAKFGERGRLWWARNPAERRYVGRRNLELREAMRPSGPIAEEWIPN